MQPKMLTLLINVNKTLSLVFLDARVLTKQNYFGTE